MPIVVSDANLQRIIEEQYFLASKGGMTVLDTNNIPDFEREMFIGFLMKDLHDKRNALQST